MSEEKLDFTRPFLILGNLALLAWVFLAFFAIWLQSPVYGWLILIFTAAAIYIILRRLGCNSCYYCKSCTSGFGRLAGVFFGTGTLKKGSVGNRHGAIAFIYVLLAPLPMAFLALAVFQAFDILKVFVLAALVALSAYSASTWRRKREPQGKRAAL